MLLEEQNKIYEEVLRIAEESGALHDTLRYLAKNDLFFLLSRICKRSDMNRQWLYDRCVEVQNNPNGYIDLWAREFYKSTIITFGLNIQEVLKNPEVTIGIFSYKISIAVEFLKQIKRELEGNTLLKQLFPDILYDNPQQQSPRWNETGLLVKRKSNPKESTIMAFGIAESQPTGVHVQIACYDDIVVKSSVSTPEIIKKSIEDWELSLNLSTDGGARRYVGTRWHYNDAYATIIERGAAIPRIYPATDDGTPNGNPILYSKEYLEDKKKSMGTYSFACQMLLSPKSEDSIGFKAEWLRFWPADKFHKLNTYIIVDPANTKNKRSDYTAMLVIGVGEDENYYIIDMLRDRLDLVEKAMRLMKLVRDYKPLQVYYEQYGMQSDINAIKDVMDREQFRFNIKPVSGKLGKQDRIMRLLPLFEQNKIWLPDKCIRTSREGISQDLTKVFVNDEYLAFPYGGHEDMLDALARIRDDNVHIVPPAKNKGRRKIKVKTEYNSFK